MSTKVLVAVFDPKGVKHAKTAANAADLVKGAGWTWKPKTPVDLTNSAPYRNVQKLDPASAAQAVIDNAGANQARAATVVEEEDFAEPDVNVFDLSDAVVSAAPAPEADDVVEDEPAEVEAPVAPKPRGRAKKDA